MESTAQIKSHDDHMMLTLLVQGLLHSPIVVKLLALGGIIMTGATA